MCAILYFNLTSLKLLNLSYSLSSSVDDIVYAHDSDSDFDEPYDSKTSFYPHNYDHHYWGMF